MTTSWEAKGHHVTGSGIKFAVYSAHKYKSYEYPDPDLAELIAGFVGLLVQELKMLEMLRNSLPKREENVMSKHTSARRTPGAVWIVYREYAINQHQWGKKVEYVVTTEEAAIEKCNQMNEKLDSKFGISYQEWELDD